MRKMKQGKFRNYSFSPFYVEYERHEKILDFWFDFLRFNGYSIFGFNYWHENNRRHIEFNFWKKTLSKDWKEK